MPADTPERNLPGIYAMIQEAKILTDKAKQLNDESLALLKRAAELSKAVEEAIFDDPR